MKLKNWLLLNGEFNRVMNTLIQSKNLPTIVSWRLSKAIKPIIEQQKILEEVRNDLIKKLWEPQKDENWNDTESWKVKDENMDEFMKELKELMEVENDIEWEEIILKVSEDERLWLSIGDLEILKDIIQIELK